MNPPTMRPWNLALRLALEIAALTGLALAAWNQTNGANRWLAVVAAPLTSLNPTIAAGMVTGLVESWVRKPKVSDLENLRFDVTTVKGWFRNPATRILLVFFFSNLGSGVGTWVAGFKIFGALS
jgi:pheromone shutdown protein TraB